MKDDVLNLAPETGARFEQDTEVERLVETLAQVYYRLDADINKVRNSRTINTAKGNELDLKAREFGINRPEDEGDDIFRKRALAGRKRARSESTWEDFAEGVLMFLDADPNDVEIIIDHEQELGAVIVDVSSSVLDDSPFSTATINNFLEGMIPMSRRVVIQRSDGFQFSDPESTSEKTGKGWNEGVWTG
jgi:hypothetical protein